jgi:hypothetical protein
MKKRFFGFVVVLFFIFPIFLSACQPLPSFDIVIYSGIENGVITSDRASAREGVLVTLTISPDEDYVLRHGSLQRSRPDSATATEPVTVNSDRTQATFTMPAGNVTIFAKFVLLDDYSFELHIDVMGEAHVITKGEIKEIFEDNVEKRVIHTTENPVRARDRTDRVTGLPIDHTVEGVYLDDILEYLEVGRVTTDFASIRLMDNGIPPYTVTVTPSTGFANIFEPNPAERDRIIIAFMYDEIVLNPEEPSGELRSVLPNSPMNSWVKGLFRIVLGDEIIVWPTTTEVFFMERLPLSFYDSFLRVDSGTEFEGISIEKLFGEIIDSNYDGFLFIRAADGMSDVKLFADYKNAFFVMEDAGEDAPRFTSADMWSGMTVKNVTSAQFGNTAFVSLQTVPTMAEVFELLSLSENVLYTVTNLSGEKSVVQGSVLKAMSTDNIASFEIRLPIEGFEIEIWTDGGFIIVTEDDLMGLGFVTIATSNETRYAAFALSDLIEALINAGRIDELESFSGINVYSLDNPTVPSHQAFTSLDNLHISVARYVGNDPAEDADGPRFIPGGTGVSNGLVRRQIFKIEFVNV